MAKTQKHSGSPTGKKVQPKIAALPARGGLVLLILTVLVGAAILYFVLGTTTIIVTREPIAVEGRFRVMLTENTEGQEEESLPLIAAQRLEVSVEASEAFVPESGAQTVEQQATGTVTIYNTWSQEQPLAATTRLLSENGVLFRIPARVDVPPGGSVTSPIYADKPGKSGEIGATRFTIPGLWAGLQDKIYAESTEPTVGGVREVTLLTEADMLKARSAVQTKALELGTEAFANLEIAEGLTFAPSSVVQELQRETSTAELGETVEQFTLTREETQSGFALDQAALKALAREELLRTLPGDQTLTEEALDMTLVFSSPIRELPMQVEVLATGKALLKENADAFDAARMTLRSAESITRYFADVEGVGNVEVRFSPFWVTRSPGNPAQITVVVR